MSRIETYRVLLWGGVCLTVCCWAAAAGAAPLPRVVDSVDASAIYIEEVKIAPGETLLVETIASPGADEAIHIVEAWGGAALAYGAWPRPVPSPISAWVEYKNNGATEIIVHIIVRSEGAPGQAQLIVNGVARPDPIPVGGTLLNADDLQDEPGGFLDAVGQPGGSEWPVMILFGDYSAKTPTFVALQGGAAGNTRSPWDLDTRAILMGTPHFRDLGGVTTVARPGVANLYVNDKNDVDKDGVGDLLEEALGMCNGTNPGAAACRYATTSIDTDRDGLPDGEELLGYFGYPSQDIAWPRWGADPMHKDAFFVVAWLTYVAADVGNPVSPFDPWPSAGTLVSWLTEVAAPYSTGPADQLGNPDGVDGLALHFDVGLPAAVPSDEALYGQWHDDVVHAIPEAHIVQISGKFVGNVVVVVSATLPDGTTVGGAKWFNASKMTPGMVALALQESAALASDGALAGVVSYTPGPPELWTVHHDAAVPGTTFTLQVIPLDPTGQAAMTLVAEGNPSIRAHEDDPGYVPHELARRTRYAVLASGGNADRAAGRFVSRFSALTFRHELGHSLNLQHVGSPQWQMYDEYVASGLTAAVEDATERSVALQCMPHYNSIMNYAFENFTFAAGAGLAAFDPPIAVNEARLLEGFTFPGMVPSRYGVSWVYDLDVGTAPDWVDWNRDGGLTPGWLEGVAPRFAVGISECWPFHVGGQELDAGTSSGSSDLVVWNGTAYAVYADTAGQVLLRSAAVGATSDSGCTGFEDVYDIPHSIDPNYAYNEPTLGCLTWSGVGSLGVNGVRELAVGAWDGALVVASVTDSGILHVRRYDAPGAAPAIDVQMLSMQAVGRPEIGFIHASSAAAAGWTTRQVVMFADAVTGEYLGFYWDPTTSDWIAWPAFSQAHSAAAGVHVLSGAGSPAIVSWPDLGNTAFPSDDRRSCGFFPDANQGLRPYCFDPVLLLWHDVSDSVWAGNSVAQPCTADQVHAPNAGAAGRCLTASATAPSLAFRYLRDDVGLPLAESSADGVLMATWTRTSNQQAYVGISSVVTDAAGLRPSDGGWNYVYTGRFKNPFLSHTSPQSIALYEDATLGATWALVAEAGNRLLFLPNADGSVDHDMYVGSDFGVIEDFLCRYIQPASVGGPVACLNETGTPTADPVNVFEAGP